MSLRKTRLDGLAGLVTLPIPTETASPDLRPTPLANKRQRWFEVSPPSFESACRSSKHGVKNRLNPR